MHFAIHIDIYMNYDIYVDINIHLYIYIHTHGTIKVDHLVYPSLGRCRLIYTGVSINVGTSLAGWFSFMDTTKMTWMKTRGSSRG